MRKGKPAGVGIIFIHRIPQAYIHIVIMRKAAILLALLSISGMALAGKPKPEAPHLTADDFEEKTNDGKVGARFLAAWPTARLVHLETRLIAGSCFQAQLPRHT